MVLLYRRRREHTNLADLSIAVMKELNELQVCNASANHIRETYQDSKLHVTSSSSVGIFPLNYMVDLELLAIWWDGNYKIF